MYNNMQQEVKKISITKIDFLDYISNIDKLLELNLSFGDTDEETMLNQLQKLDTVHDFGTTRGNNLSKDALSRVKDSIFYSYNSMRLFFIQKYSFPTSAEWCSTIKPINVQMFSNISYPGVGQYQRVVNDVEDYCFLLALKNSISKGGKTKNNFKFIGFDPKEIETLKPVKQQLSEYFFNYTDKSGTGKINFLVDTPGHITKVLKSDKSNNDFAYIFLQESAHDSAKGTPTTLEPQVINDAYNGNGFCEVFGQTRKYIPGIIEPSNFESNFTITFSGMSYNDKSIKSFQTTVTYEKEGFNSNPFPCILNSSVHPTSVPKISKDVGEFTKGNDLKLNETSMTLLKENNITEFYNSFGNPINNYNYLPVNKNLLDFNFTKKRAGDGLQVRVCQRINDGTPINFWKMGSGVAGCDNKKEYIITKVILVTIDRVLFSYCIKNNVPAIYSGQKCFLLYNPLLTPDAIPQIQNKPSKSPSEESLIALTSQSGGNLEYQEENKNFAKQFSDIPFYLYKLLPKIINNIIGVDRNLQDQAINLLLNINDDALTTIYANNRICLYCQEDVDKYGGDNNTNGINEFDKNFVVWLNNGEISVEKTTINSVSDTVNFNFISTMSSGVTFNFNFNTEDIISVINKAGYFSFVRNGNIPLLDTYYELILTKVISLDPTKLQDNNVLTISAYFNIFSYYESCLCCDNEEYYQSFNNDNNIEVTNKITMYVMFKQLLDDFTEKQNEICYGLLEYFLNCEDTKQHYFDISDDLEKVMYYVFSNYNILGRSLNVRIIEMISTKQIDVNNLIFTNTLRYFQELYPKILKQTKEIEDFFSTTSNTKHIESNIYQYIKKYLTTYGFMNMSNNFKDKQTENNKNNLLKVRTQIEEKIPLKELLKQKRTRPEINETLDKKIEKGVIKMKTGRIPIVNENNSNINGSLESVPVPVLGVGGKKSIKYKKRTTRKVKKIKNIKKTINVKKKTIKKKRRHHKTRKHR